MRNHKLVDARGKSSQTATMRKGDHPHTKLRAVLEQRGLKSVDLCRMTGISSAYISDIVNAVKPGSAQKWKQIARALGMSIEDLLPDPDLGFGNIQALPEGHPIYQVPIRGYIKAGPVDEVVEDAAGTGAIGFEWLTEQPGDGIDVFEIYGDSMEPMFHAGDRLICKRVTDPEDRPVSGTPVIAEYVPPDGSERDRRCTFKIYLRNNGTEILAPINRDHYDLIVMKRPRWTIKAIVTEVHSYRHAGRYAALEEEVFGKVAKPGDTDVN